MQPGGLLVGLMCLVLCLGSSGSVLSVFSSRMCLGALLSCMAPLSSCLCFAIDALIAASICLSSSSLQRQEDISKTIIKQNGLDFDCCCILIFNRRKYKQTHTHTHIYQFGLTWSTSNSSAPPEDALFLLDYDAPPHSPHRTPDLNTSIFFTFMACKLFLHSNNLGRKVSRKLQLNLLPPSFLLCCLGA